MRRRNWRVIITGFVLLLGVLAFYFYMLSIASKSNNPAELMRTVGQVAGAVGGIAIAMMIFGLIGRKE
jgi:hypothetical protein